MADFKTAWEDSYERRENTLFYPSEEVVRFVNRSIRRRIAPDAWSREFDSRPVVLDLGSGAGRHMVFFWENGLMPIGLELSETACAQARALLSAAGAAESDYRMINASAEALPLEDASVDYAVSVSTLDSMPTEIAIAAVAQVVRVLRPGGLFYADVISTEKLRAGDTDDDLDQIVAEDHELGTVQSYYDHAKLQRVFSGLDVVRLERISRETPQGEALETRWHGTFRKPG